MKLWRTAILFGTGMLLAASIACSCDGRRDDDPLPGEIHTEEYLDSAMELLADKPDDLTLNRRVWGYYTETGRYDVLIKHAEPVFERSSGVDGKERLALAAGAFILQAYVLKEEFGPVPHYLERIIPLAKGEYGDDPMSAIVHNAAALYYLKTELDYSAALEHYEAALKIMERNGETANQSTLLCNIASIYATLRDSAGFGYAQSAYDINHSDKPGLRPYGRVLSTILLAQMYHLNGDYANAGRYADEASGKISAFPQFMSSLDLIYADIAFARADYTRADTHYRRALSHGSEAEPSAIVPVYLRYGVMLIRLGRYSEAQEMLQRGLGLRGLEYRGDLLLALSDVAVRQGREKDALDLYRQYHACLDSVSYVQRERAFQQNRILVKNNELQSRELDLLKANRRIVIIVLTSVLILLLAVGLWIANRRLGRMYRRMVKVHQQLLMRVNVTRDPEKEGEGDLGLWKKLEDIMVSERIYRNRDISLDRIAEILGTNRTYVSRVINKYSGASFYDYIHSRRINDASLMLSDLSRDIPLKALAFELGYNSISSFYRAFLKETGVPPSRYREEVLRIRQDSDPTDV